LSEITIPVDNRELVRKLLPRKEREGEGKEGILLSESLRK